MLSKQVAETVSVLLNRQTPIRDAQNVLAYINRLMQMPLMQTQVTTFLVSVHYV